MDAVAAYGQVLIDDPDRFVDNANPTTRPPGGPPRRHHEAPAEL